MELPNVPVTFARFGNNSESTVFWEESLEGPCGIGEQISVDGRLDGDKTPVGFYLGQRPVLTRG